MRDYSVALGSCLKTKIEMRGKKKKKGKDVEKSKIGGTLLDLEHESEARGC